MNDPEAKLKKLRTFYDDVNKVQNSHSNEAFTEEPKADPLMKARLKEAAPAELPLEDIAPEKVVPSGTIEKPPLRESIPKPRITPVAVMPVMPRFEPAPKINIVELEKKIDVSSLRQNASDSLLSGHGAIFSTIEEGNEADLGNIITDQKRDRFKLLPAIFEASRGWFHKQQTFVTKLMESKEIVPEISDVSGREEVLKDAAERSALAPQDDYSTVAKRIQKTVRVAPAPTTLIIKKPSEIPAPSWTHVEDSEAETVEVKAEPVAPKIETPSVVPAKMVENQPSLVVESEIKATEEVTPVLPDTNLPSIAVTKEPLPIEEVVPEVENANEEAGDTWFESRVEATPVLPSESVPEIDPEPDPLPETSQAPMAKTYASPANPTFPIWRVGAVAVVAIFLGVSLTFWLFNTDDTAVVVNNENQFTALLNAEEEVPVDLGHDNQTLLRNLQAVQPRPTTMTVITYPTINNSAGTIPATAADILNTVAWQAPGSFIRGVTDINFGFYKKTNPFIVLKVTSFDTAFGGILEWEQAMSADLAPLFGAPVLGTFDPLARTATQIRDPYFTDVIVNNIDSRILTDETQKERLIYAFADRNTIIITTNRSTIGDLLNLLR